MKSIEHYIVEKFRMSNDTKINPFENIDDKNFIYKCDYKIEIKCMLINNSDAGSKIASEIEDLFYEGSVDSLSYQIEIINKEKSTIMSWDMWFDYSPKDNNEYEFAEINIRDIKLMKLNEDDIMEIIMNVLWVSSELEWRDEYYDEMKQQLFKNIHI